MCRTIRRGRLALSARASRAIFRRVEPALPTCPLLGMTHASIAACGDGEAHSAQERLESRIRPQRIEYRAQENRSLESRPISLVQPTHGFIRIAKPHIDQCDIR